MISFRLVTPLVMLAVVLAFDVTARASSPSQPKTVDDSSYQGRLATVEPSRRRLTLIPKGEWGMVELVLPEDGEIWHGSRELSLSDLVLEIGSRIRVRYRHEDGRRVAQSITVEPPPLQ